MVTQWVYSNSVLLAAIIGAVTTIIASVIAVIFAWITSKTQKRLAEEQNSLQDKQFKFQLFKERFKLYTDVELALSMVITHDDSQESHVEIKRLLAPFFLKAEFLFDKAMGEFSEQLADLVYQYCSLAHQFEARRNNLSEEKQKRLDEVASTLIDERGKLKERFSKFLTIE